MRRLLPLLLLLCAFAPCSADGKKKKRKAPAISATLSALIDAQSPAVQACVLRHGIQLGARKVDVTIHVTVNGAGEVMDCRVLVAQTGGSGDGGRGCIESALRDVRYPHMKEPLATVDKNWSFAIQ